ncbi:MAG: DUF3291 domain-containing protein [Rhodospirillaceae bacterium]|nr:DUF3291 domain-containing protein [Rhodospirillaceae bacterium]
MPTVSVTRLRLRSAWYAPAFLWYSVTSIQQAKRAEGNLGAFVRQSNGAYWTLTMWRDVAAMRAFMLSGAHRKAMPHLVNWCDEAATARFDWTGDSLPSWNEAERQLATHGKTSPVKHPSPAHAAGKTLGTSQDATKIAPAVAS